MSDYNLGIPCEEYNMELTKPLVKVIQDAQEYSRKAGYVEALDDVIMELGKYAEHVPAMVKVSGMKANYLKDLP